VRLGRGNGDRLHASTISGFESQFERFCRNLRLEAKDCGYVGDIREPGSTFEAENLRVPVAVVLSLVQDVEVHGNARANVEDIEIVPLHHMEALVNQARTAWVQLAENDADVGRASVALVDDLDAERFVSSLRGNALWIARVESKR
jgi:hypothetical protein